MQQRNPLPFARKQKEGLTIPIRRYSWGGDGKKLAKLEERLSGRQTVRNG
jgi:hypothetical protein